MDKDAIIELLLEDVKSARYAADEFRRDLADALGRPVEDFPLPWEGGKVGGKKPTQINSDWKVKLYDAR